MGRRRSKERRPRPAPGPVRPAEPTPSASPVEAFVEGLRGPAPAEPGTFSMDRERAKATLRRQRMPVPHHHVLHLLRAAVRRGARFVHCDQAGDTLEIRFDGRPLSRADLDRLWDAGLDRDADGSRPGLHELALGLAAAGTLDFRSIRVTSGSGPRAVELVLRPGAEDEVRAVTREMPTTVVRLEGRPRWGGILPARWPELDVLRERGQHLDSMLKVNGQVVSEGFALRDAGRQMQQESGASRCLVAVGRRRAEPASVRLLVDGVWVSTRPLPGVGSGIVALATDGDLALDALGIEVVEDAAHDRLVDLVQRTAGRVQAEEKRLAHPEAEAPPPRRSEAVEAELRILRRNLVVLLCTMLCFLAARPLIAGLWNPSRVRSAAASNRPLEGMEDSRPIPPERCREYLPLVQKEEVRALVLACLILIPILSFPYSRRGYLAYAVGLDLVGWILTLADGSTRSMVLESFGGLAYSGILLGTVVGSILGIIGIVQAHRLARLER